MKSRTSCVFALVTAFTFLAGSAGASGPSCSDQLKEPLLDAATAAGVAINPDSVVTTSGPGYTIAATTIKGSEQVVASDFPNGVDTGFVYFDAPGSGIPAGFYKLRTTADAGDVRMGEFGGKVEFVGADGKVAAALPVQVQASALASPDALPSSVITIDTQTDTPEPEAKRLIIRVRVTVVIVTQDAVYIFRFEATIVIP